MIILLPCTSLLLRSAFCPSNPAVKVGADEIKWPSSWKKCQIVKIYGFSSSLSSGSWAEYIENPIYICHLVPHSPLSSSFRRLMTRMFFRRLTVCRWSSSSSRWRKSVNNVFLRFDTISASFTVEFVLGQCCDIAVCDSGGLWYQRFRRGADVDVIY